MLLQYYSYILYCRKNKKYKKLKFRSCFFPPHLVKTPTFIQLSWSGGTLQKKLFRIHFGLRSSFLQRSHISDTDTNYVQGFPCLRLLKNKWSKTNKDVVILKGSYFSGLSWNSNVNSQILHEYFHFSEFILNKHLSSKYYLSLNVAFSTCILGLFTINIQLQHFISMANELTQSVALCKWQECFKPLVLEGLPCCISNQVYKPKRPPLTNNICNTSELHLCEKADRQAAW